MATHLRPWIRRRLRGQSSGDGRSAKRPDVLPLESWIDPATEELAQGAAEEVRPLEPPDLVAEDVQPLEPPDPVVEEVQPLEPPDR